MCLSFTKNIIEEYIYRNSLRHKNNNSIVTPSYTLHFNVGRDHFVVQKIELVLVSTVLY